MTTATAPTPQHLEQLGNANRIRSGMAERKRQLKALGSRDSLLLAAEWIANPDETIARMRLDALLGAITRFGPTRSRRLAERVGTVGLLSRRIGPRDVTYGSPPSLTEMRRQAIAAELRRAAERLPR